MENGPEGSNRQGTGIDEVAREGAPGCAETAAAFRPGSVRSRYFDLYDLAPVGYCTLNESGVIVQANRAASTLLNTSPGALVGQAIARFIAPADSGVYEQLRRRLAESRGPQSCELRMLPVAPGVTDAGASLWVHLSAVAAEPALADGAAVVSAPEYRLVLTDVTQRRMVEEALREQKEFFHLIAENIGDFIAVLDRDGRRIYNSPSYLSFFGAQRDLHGTNSFADVHPDDRERVRSAFVETVKTGQGRGLEYRMVIADGASASWRRAAA